MEVDGVLSILKQFAKALLSLAQFDLDARAPSDLSDERLVCRSQLDKLLTNCPVHFAWCRRQGLFRSLLQVVPVSAVSLSN
jgi:hypothetical protein